MPAQQELVDLSKLWCTFGRDDSFHNSERLSELRRGNRRDVISSPPEDIQTKDGEDLNPPASRKAIPLA